MTLDEAMTKLPSTAQQMISFSNNYKSEKHLKFKQSEFKKAIEDNPYSVYIDDFTLASGTSDIIGVTGIYREPTDNCSNEKHIILVEYDIPVGIVYPDKFNIENNSITKYMSYYETNGNKIHNCPRNNKLKPNEFVEWTWKPLENKED